MSEHRPPRLRRSWLFVGGAEEAQLQRRGVEPRALKRFQVGPGPHGSTGSP